MNVQHRSNRWIAALLCGILGGIACVLIDLDHPLCAVLLGRGDSLEGLVFHGCRLFHLPILYGLWIGGGLYLAYLVGRLVVIL